MKGIFVILDGVADEPCQALGMITPLQAARTPYLDALARKSRIDYCYPIKEGVAPESTAVASLLGYDINMVSRGPLEALGAAVPFRHGDLVLRTNFATIDDISMLNLLDRRVGRTLGTKEASVLARAINEKVKLPYKFELYPTIQHRAVIVFRGGFSDNISNVDPHYKLGGASGSSNRIKFSEPLDDDDAEAKVAADLVNMFVRKSFEVLDVHPLNKARASNGLYAANFLLCRDPGNEVPRFAKMKGNWMAMAYMPLEIGIAKAAKIDVYSFSYPSLRGIDAYDNLYAGLKKAIKRAIKMIKKYYLRYDYFLVHLKETDIPGHDNKPLDKTRMLEMIDKRFFSFLVPFVAKRGGRVVITADHTTSCRLKAHSDKPVPVLYYAGAGEEKEQCFTEEQGLIGKKIAGRKLLEHTLFAD